MLLMAACANQDVGEEQAGKIKLTWSAEEASLFPAKGGLTHAEDGVVLPDGRLLVGDYEHGLITIAPDGALEPFGDFAAAGFQNGAHPQHGGPNGITFEPDGRHVLVADIFTGSLYRVDTQSRAVTRIYDHPFGINAVVRDRTGAIWFTQSTENSAGTNSEGRMFAAVDKPLGDGAVYRIAPDQLGKLNPAAELKVSSLDFANGIAIDEVRGTLYVDELMANRVLAFAVDTQTGTLSSRRTLAEIPTPDNIEVDADGRLWVASPISNSLFVIDSGTGKKTSAFAPTPSKNDALRQEFNRRLANGESTLELIGPPMWGPMPGLLTGVILSPDDGPVYIAGLGAALVKLDR